MESIRHVGRRAQCGLHLARSSRLWSGGVDGCILEGVSSERFELTSSTVRADHLARLDQLAARKGVGRSDLLGRAIDALLACDDLSGGYVGVRNGLSVEGLVTEEITAPIRSDHLRRLDLMAQRRSVDRSELIGRAIDAFLAKEAMIGAFGVPGTAAWFAPPNDSSIWATLRSTVGSRKRSDRPGRSARARSGDAAR